MRFVALAMPPAIKSNKLKTSAGIEFGVAVLVTSPHTGISHPAMDEDNRFALSFSHVVNLHSIRIKETIFGPGHPTHQPNRQGKAAHQ